MSARLDQESVPPWLRGVWRRTYYRGPDGVEDTSGSVYWVQTNSLFADVRIPEAILRMQHHSGLGGYAKSELMSLATARGFAGHAVVDKDICRWHRPIDFQPPSGFADAGRLRLERNELWEYGLDVDYVETYRRIADGSTRLAAFSLQNDSREGILAIVDEWIIRALGRRQMLPPAPSLQAFIAKQAESARIIEDAFDCEVSLAVGFDGRVLLSTQPWLIGKPLARGFTTVNGLLIEELSPTETRTWACRGLNQPLTALIEFLNHDQN
jgi:hypothetical protein